MSKMYVNGELVSGSTSNASYVNCIDKDGNKSTVQAEIDKLNSFISGTLLQGEETLVLNDSRITTDCLVDVYTTIFGVCPLSVVTESGIMTLTFTAQETDMGVKVRCL